MRNLSPWALVLLLSATAPGWAVSVAQAQQEDAGPADDAATPAEEGTGDEAATEPTPPAPPPPREDEAAPPDLSALLTDFESLMDELVQARSRIAVLGRQLFRTRIRVVVQDRAGRDQSLDHVRIRLDAAPVFDAEGSDANVGEGRQVFEGVAAPGPHTLTLEVSHRARGEGGDAFVAERVTTVRFNVRQGEMTTLTVVVDDDSDIAERYADGGEGEYDLRTRVRLSTQALPDAPAPASPEEN